MQLNKRKHATTATLNMTPMIDVVFLLLIFFMTVSQVSEASRERLELPKIDALDEQQSSEVIINVTQDGQWVVMGKYMTLADVARMLSDQLASVGDDPSRIAVTIRADERGASGPVNELVRLLSRLDITRVRIAVQSPD